MTRIATTLVTVMQYSILKYMFTKLAVLVEVNRGLFKIDLGLS